MNYSITANGEKIPLRVVENQSWGGAQQIIVNESVGTNGGVVLITGRTNNTITLNGKFLPSDKENPMESLNEIKTKLNKIKDKGIPIILTAPIDNDDTGVYIISELTGSVVAGVSTYLPFTMTLVEYRQANLKRTIVNLISLEPAEEFKNILRTREILS